MNLRRRFSVRARSGERDAHERLREWEHKFYVWCEAPREGSTTFIRDAALQMTEDSYRLRTRYRTDIEIGDQLVGGSDAFLVRAAHDVDGTKHWLQLVLSRTPSPGT